MFSVIYSCGRCGQTFTNVSEQSAHTFNCGKKKTETKPVKEVLEEKEESTEDEPKPETKRRGRPSKQG